MDTFTIIRLVLPLVAAGIFRLVATFLKVPIPIRQKALQVGILTGIINIAVDAIGLSLNLWHYNLTNLILGYPLDIYVTVAIVFGGVVLMVFWWIREHQPRWTLPFLVFLPIFGLQRDYVWSRITDVVISFDSPYWWIGDILAWMAVFWIPIYVFNQITSHRKKADASAERSELVGATELNARDSKHR